MKINDQNFDGLMVIYGFGSLLTLTNTTYQGDESVFDVRSLFSLPLSHLIFYQDFQFFDGSSNSESSCVILKAAIIFRPEKKVELFFGCLVSQLIGFILHTIKILI